MENTLPVSKLVKDQVKTRVKEYTEDNLKHIITAKIRFDDRCGNGHNTFSLTGSIDYIDERGHRREGSGGCIHEEIIKHFPELEKFVKWHLTSTDGPMHYIANTLYHASDTDHHGRRKGEPCKFEPRLVFKGFPVMFNHFDDIFYDFVTWMREAGGDQRRFKDVTIVPVHHAKEPNGYKFEPKYTYSAFPLNKWHQGPFDTAEEAQEYLTAFQTFEYDVISVPTELSEGKERDLAAARHSAVWPDATDEQLLQEPKKLQAHLEARLPELMEKFKRDMEELGFIY